MQEAIIGEGYTGGKNLDLSATLDTGDRFGSSVSIDGDRLAVGARLDDGSGNANTDSGAAYLFSFTDSVFSGGVLEATVGSGYTGGKNVDVGALENFDAFGTGVSINGNRLVAGAHKDDGFGNAANNSGAAYLFSFTDSAFNGGLLDATIGKGYTGGKNIDLGALEADDSFALDVSLDGNALARKSHQRN